MFSYAPVKDMCLWIVFRYISKYTSFTVNYIKWGKNELKYVIMTHKFLIWEIYPGGILYM